MADCEWAEPIYPSNEDELTIGTARQILEHNEKGARICGWEQPEKTNAETSGSN